ncbi:MAG: thioredoxin family protein [Candidatus Marinimicrobia bacterium]|nr:thioredoxin family protein [Candidatus Neomarinimicrobiota bacterium]MCF7903921.1 thioredoxin family protein [Candidatus Neomarinimicrobiota bacterium]
MKHQPLVMILALVVSTSLFAKGAEVGKPAPDFTLQDPMGITVSLNDFKGKHVVLEWVNYDCPFVKKHYNSGNMQMLQAKYTEQGVVWLTINSSAPGKQGNYSTKEILQRSREHNTAFSAYLRDESGKVGRAYGAKTTPHMFVVDPQGMVIYAGGIDDIRSTNVKDIDKATNYVAAALDAALAGKAVATSTSKPYGCSVKY